MKIDWETMKNIIDFDLRTLAIRPTLQKLEAYKDAVVASFYRPSKEPGVS